jgi:hypothetical protein
MDVLAILKDFGFPVFVAVFVLCRLEPAVKRLDQSISALAVIVAKSNGMKNRDVREIVDAVAKNSDKRRLTDRLGYNDSDSGGGIK